MNNPNENKSADGNWGKKISSVAMDKKKSVAKKTVDGSKGERKNGWESWQGLAKRNRENQREQSIKAGTYRKSGSTKDTRTDFMKRLDEHKTKSAFEFR